MDLEYPKGFPDDHQTLVEVERVRADRDFRLSDPRVAGSASELERRGLNWVCRVLGAFCHQACELGKDRRWTLMEIRSSVQGFRLDLVRYVQFQLSGGRLRWVDRVFGTTIESEIRREIENSEEWKRYLEELSAVAEALATSAIPKTIPVGDIGAADPQLSGDAPAAGLMSDAASRARRLEQFKEEHGVSFAKIARSAGVHKPDFQAWRNGKLKAESIMAQRIESVLRGKHPLDKKSTERQD